jgi:hypothetical protein
MTRQDADRQDPPKATRRGLLAAAGAAVLMAGSARAGWEPSLRIPDPAIKILDDSFRKYWVFSATVERLYTGCRWAEGPVWMGDWRSLIWSDVTGNMMMRWDEVSGQVSAYRSPSNFSNGNSRDRQGRLITCEHMLRRVTRTELDGSLTVIADKFEGKPLNSPNDIVSRSDGSIWFTDPAFGPNPAERMSKPELPHTVYRWAPDGKLTALATDLLGPRRSSTSSNRAPARARSVPMTSWMAAPGSPTAASSSTRGRARPPTDSAATPTATCGAAGAKARTSSTASGCSRRKASRSPISRCPSDAPTCASAASTTTGCSWRRRTRSTR